MNARKPNWGGALTESKSSDHNETATFSMGGVHTRQAAEGVEDVSHNAQLARALPLLSRSLCEDGNQTFSGD